MIRRLRLLLAGSLIGGFMIWASGCEGCSGDFLSFSGTVPDAIVGEPFAPTIQVQVRTNCAILSTSEAVTLALGANPGGATLSGTLTVNARDGVASFSDLAIDRAGSGYTLTATATGFDSATSQAFDVR